MEQQFGRYDTPDKKDGDKMKARTIRKTRQLAWVMGVVALIWTIFGCSKNPEEPTPPPEPQKPIMALAVGNYFVYREIEFDSTGRVVQIDTFEIRFYRDSIIDGETWYYTTPTGANRIYSNQADGLWQKILRDGPWLLAKYPTVPGDKWETVMGMYSAETIAKSQSTSVPAGSFDCVFYCWTPRYESFGPVRHWLCPGIGLVRSEEESQRRNGTWYLSNRSELMKYEIVK